MFPRQSAATTDVDYTSGTTSRVGGITKQTQKDKLHINFNELPLPEPDDMPESIPLPVPPDMAMDLFDQFYSTIMLGIEIERLFAIVASKDEEISAWSNKYTSFEATMGQQLEAMRGMHESLRLSQLREKELWEQEMSRITQLLQASENKAALEAEKVRKALEENARLQRELENLRGQVGASGTRIQQLEEELRTKLGQLNSQLAQVTRERELWEEQAQSLRQEKIGLENQLGEKDRMYKIKISELEASSRTRINELELELENLRNQLADRDRTHRGKLSELESLSRSKYAEYERELDDLRNQLGTRETTSKGQEKEFRTKLSENERKILDLTAEIDRWRHEVEMREENLADARKKIKDLENLREKHLREIQQLTNDAELLSQKLQLLEDEKLGKANAMTTQISSLTKERERLESELNSLKDKILHLEGQLSDSKREHQKTLQTIERMNLDHRRQLEELASEFGAKIQTLEQLLAETKKEREKVKSVWDKKDNDYRAQLTVLNEEIERLAAGEGRMETMTRSLNDKERELNEWRLAVKERDAHIQRLTIEITSLTEAKESAERELIAFQRRAMQSDQNTKEIARLNGILAARDKEIESLHEELRSNKGRIDTNVGNLKAYIAELERKIQFLNEEKEHLETLNVSRMKELEAWKTKAVNFEVSLREVNELRTSIAMLKGENERLTRSYTEYLEDIKTRTVDVQVRQKLEISIVTLGAENNRLHGLIAELETYRKLYNDMVNNQNTTMNKDIAEKETIIASYHKEIERLRERNLQLEFTISEKNTSEINFAGSRKYIQDLEAKVLSLVADLEKLNSSLRERTTLHEADKLRILALEKALAEIRGNYELTGLWSPSNFSDLRTRIQTLSSDHAKLIREVDNIKMSHVNFTPPFDRSVLPMDFIAFQRRDVTQLEAALQNLRAALLDYQNRFVLLAGEFERLKWQTGSPIIVNGAPVISSPSRASPIGMRSVFMG